MAILLGFSSFEHSAQAETLDMQEAAGSNPAPPTRPLNRAQVATLAADSGSDGDYSTS
jgi:hypothetical protein